MKEPRFEIKDYDKALNYAYQYTFWRVDPRTSIEPAIQWCVDQFGTPSDMDDQPAEGVRWAHSNIRIMFMTEIDAFNFKMRWV